MLRRQKTAVPRELHEGWRLEFIGRESVERRESRLPVTRPNGILWEIGGGTAMPYPMVHLLTARRWAAEKPDRAREGDHAGSRPRLHRWGAADAEGDPDI